MVKAHFKGMKTQLLLVLGDDNTHKYRCLFNFCQEVPLNPTWLGLGCPDI